MPFLSLGAPPGLLLLFVFEFFFGISHTQLKDIRSARSWNGNHLLPTGQFHCKGFARASKGLVFWPFPFPLYFFPKCVPPFSGFSRWYRYLQSAVHPCFHTTRQVDCSPWRLSVPHPARQSRFRLIYPTPSAPCRQRLPRSSDVHR